jgi:hypothetical protein
MTHLPDIDRRRNTTQPHASEVQQVGTLGVAPSCAVDHRLSHQHLPAVRGVHYPRSAIHGRPKVVAVACLGCAAVKAAAHLQREVGFARERLNASLQLDRGRQRLEGIFERGV